MYRASFLSLLFSWKSFFLRNMKCHYTSCWTRTVSWKETPFTAHKVGRRVAQSSAVIADALQRRPLTKQIFSHSRKPARFSFQHSFMCCCCCWNCLASGSSYHPNAQFHQSPFLSDSFFFCWNMLLASPPGDKTCILILYVIFFVKNNYYYRKKKKKKKNARTGVSRFHFPEWPDGWGIT